MFTEDFLTVEAVEGIAALSPDFTDEDCVLCLEVSTVLVFMNLLALPGKSFPLDLKCPFLYGMTKSSLKLSHLE